MPTNDVETIEEFRTRWAVEFAEWEAIRDELTQRLSGSTYLRTNGGHVPASEVSEVQRQRMKERGETSVLDGAFARRLINRASNVSGRRNVPPVTLWYFEIQGLGIRSDADSAMAKLREWIEWEVSRDAPERDVQRALFAEGVYYGMRLFERIVDPPIEDVPQEVSSGGGRAPMPNPTEEEQRSPLFEALWQTIKTWDVNVPEYYVGYCGANGSHVKLLLDAVRRHAQGTRRTREISLPNERLEGLQLTLDQVVNRIRIDRHNADVTLWAHKHADPQPTNLRKVGALVDALPSVHVPPNSTSEALATAYQVIFESQSFDSDDVTVALGAACMSLGLDVKVFVAATPNLSGSLYMYFAVKDESGAWQAFDLFRRRNQLVTVLASREILANEPPKGSG